jgi:cell division inhibitor SulA
LTEISGERFGVGELQLIMPAAARLTQAGRWIVMIAPPHIPYAPALAGHGIRLSQLMLVRPTTDEEESWACEQALRATCCGAVLMWTDHIRERSIRRLQLAAEGGGTLAMLFRSNRAMPLATAALRLHVGKSDGKTVVHILKRRGGGMPAPVALDLHGRLTERGLPVRSGAPAYIPSLEATHRAIPGT